MPGFCFGPRGYCLPRWEDGGPQGGSTEQPTTAFNALGLACEPGAGGSERQVFFKSVLLQGLYEIDLLCLLMSGRKFGVRALYTGLKVLRLIAITSEAAVI